MRSGPLDEHGEIVAVGNPEAQTRKVLERIVTVLNEAGATLDHMVKATVFIKDNSYFGVVNQVWDEFFTGTPPARSVIQVGFGHPDLLVEIEGIAVLSD